MSVPVTPCAPRAAVAFLEARFGADVSKTLDPVARIAKARERRITELRRCGELRHAERYGWLSLAGWLLDMKATTVSRIDPTSTALLHRTRSRDVLPDPLGEDPPPALRLVKDTGIEVSDPRDPLGYGVIELAVAAILDGTVEVDGRRVAGGAIAASLRDRLVEVAHG
jgi:hypothetical protein